MKSRRKDITVRNFPSALAKVIEMAVCMANGDGGTVVIGIWDNIIGRVNAILGVPPQIYPIV